jgi:hypothetical protein
LVSQLERESKEAKYDNYPDSQKAKEVFNNLTPAYRKSFD